MTERARPDTPEPAAPEPAAIEGRIDAVSDGRVFGWAWDRSRPDEAVEVELRVAGGPGEPERFLAAVRAELPREDLRANGVGDGRHAFEAAIELPPGIEPGRIEAVARSPSTGARLVLRRPSDGERLVEQALAPHLARITAEIDAARREQQQIAGLQRGLWSTMRELRQQVPPLLTENFSSLRDVVTEGASQLDGLATETRQLQERLAAQEVFLMRIDGALRELDGSLKRAQGDANRRSQRATMMAVGGVGMVLVAILFVLRAGLA